MGLERQQDKADRPFEPSKAVKPAVSDVPQSRGVILLSFHNAARELFGVEGLRAIGERLSDADRAASIEASPLPLAWYPSTYLAEWCDAALSAGAKGDVARFHAFLRRSTDLGFGRIRRTLLRLVGPAGLVPRAAELWRHDHSTGSLDVLGEEPSGVRAAIRNHPFLATHASQGAIAEIIRDILSRARGVKRVTESHAMESGALQLRFSWG